MKKCGICNKRHSHFLMNNKMVCLTCDELLIDIEIECDEDPVVIRKDPTTSLYRSEAKTKESSN